jgi:Transcription factor WhiB
VLPGALCRQHPDPDLWTSDMRSEQEEARRVCRIRPELADCRAGTLAQPAYRIDAGMVAAMTPAERFAERRKRRQKPWLAKLEPVRPGPVARHSSLTRYPGPKPPPFARRGADGHGRRRVRGIPQPERQSTRHLLGWPHGRRQAPRNGPASANPAPCASPQAVRVPGRHRA